MIKKIKTKFKATLVSLPYNLPSKLYTDLIDHTVRVINCMPNPREDQAESPREMVYRKKIKLEELTRCKFGEMGYTAVPKDHRSKQYKRAPGAAVPVIVIGFEDGTPSNLYLFDPETGGKPTRSKFEVSPDNKEIIKTMNEMAKENPILDPLIAKEISNDTLGDDSVETAKDIIAALIGDQAIDDNNMTIRQAAKKYGDQAVRQSVIAEIDNMIKMGVFNVINAKKLPRRNGRLYIPDLQYSKDFVKAKTKDGKFDKLKTRIVLRGDRQKEGTYGETKCPTVDKEALFLICALNKIIQGNIYSADVPSAFLFADIQEDVVMRLTKEMSEIYLQQVPEAKQLADENGYIYVKLKKSLYGLKQAPRNWFDKFSSVIMSAGFKQSHTNAAIFYHIQDGKCTIVCIHVDDQFVVTNDNKTFKKLQKKLQEELCDFDWEENEFNFLGMHFKRNNDFSITVDIAAYTHGILQRRWTEEIESEFSKRRGAIDPSSLDIFKIVDDEGNQATAAEVSLFKSCLMELMYMCIVRIDIIKECTYLATKSNNPGPIAWKRMRQLWAYLHDQPARSINLGADNASLTVYVDAGYAEHVDGRSHTGIFVSLGGNGGPILVKSKRQSLVTQSSTEAELLALTDGVKKTLSLSKLLVELGFNTDLHLVAMQDNQSTIQIAKNGEGMGGKAKHFRVRYHFLREMMKENVLEIKYCPTEEMIADFLTKAMTGKRLYTQHVRSMWKGDEKMMLKSQDDVRKRIEKV
jgi:hypothetical protein